MTNTAMAESKQQDESAVTAVRGGDAERYRELVERHERRVYAVAWSRLGDAALAEEVTQEAFIRAYRRLWLLGDGAKFSGWVNTIARRLAINFGLRHRRELNKRERWALETPDAADEEADPLHSPEALRQTLAELPDAHRECLVLFYLEGKSGAEAAAALGISEVTLRVRLHRARAALRERLEDKLEGSLARLRPAKTLVPAIMASVLASSSAKAATAGGVGATIFGTLTKLAPVKWLFLVFPLLFALPMLLFSWLIVRSELANYRDKQGFRARMFRADISRRLIWMLLILVVVFGVTAWGRISQEKFFLGITAFTALVWLMTWRQLVINHSRFLVVTNVANVVMLVGFVLMGFHVLSFSSLNLFIGLQVLLTSLVYGERPARMDYNLFLRAAEGMLDLPALKTPTAARPAHADKKAMLAFARFMGSRWLVDSYRWSAEGLWLRLPAFKFSLWSAMGFFVSWSHRSRLLLAWDGQVSAHLCQTDKHALQSLRTDESWPPGELENQVVAAVEGGWNHFNQGDFTRAERALGQVPEAEVFVNSPAKTGFARWRTKLLMVLLSLILILTGLQFFRPPWLDQLKPVAVTEAQVRAFLGGITTNPNPIINNRQRRSLNNPDIPLSFCLVLPPTNLFTPAALLAIQMEVFRNVGVNPQAAAADKVQSFRHGWVLHKAMAGRWVDWNAIGLTPGEATTYFHGLKTNDWKFRLTQEKAWSWKDNESWDVERIGDFTLNELRWLRDVNCLDLVDREKLIAQIASVQTLSRTPPGQPPIHDWRDVRGLFFTPGWPALQDTYFSLAALEILGGLDRIDREACIQGILKQHRGKGYFTSPNSGGFNEYHIDGSARDTFAAFESLRLLGALGRVKDLNQWQFRLKTYRASPPDASGGRTLTWEEVEAWVCEQRLKKILRVRQENPDAPIGSLLTP